MLIRMHIYASASISQSVDTLGHFFSSFYKSYLSLLGLGLGLALGKQKIQPKTAKANKKIKQNYDSELGVFRYPGLRLYPLTVIELKRIRFCPFWISVNGSEIEMKYFTKIETKLKRLIFAEELPFFIPVFSHRNLVKKNNKIFLFYQFWAEAALYSFGLHSFLLII